MPLTLEVPPEVEARLREVARQRGTDISRYVGVMVLERDEDLLTLDEAAQMLAIAPDLVARMLERGDLASLHPATALAEKRRREAANRAMDEIVSITESLGLYPHQGESV